MYRWYFECMDNGGKRQFFTVTAKSKPDAIKKGMEKAKKAASGDVTSWSCRLKTM